MPVSRLISKIDSESEKQNAGGKNKAGTGVRETAWGEGMSF